MDELKYLVKASTTLHNNKNYAIWFTIQQRASGRVKISFIEESLSQVVQGYMLLHMINQTLETLQIPFPKGLPDAKWHIKKGKHAYRFLEVKETWYRLDSKVQGYWINSSSFLAMARYVHEIPDDKVRNMSYIKEKKQYQILNPAHSPGWNITFHMLV